MVFSDLSTGRVVQDIEEGVVDEQGHISFPYHSGDIVWTTEEDAVQLRVTVQDLEGRIAGVQQRRVTGNLPLILSTGTGVT